MFKHSIITVVSSILRSIQEYPAQEELKKGTKKLDDEDDGEFHSICRNPMIRDTSVYSLSVFRFKCVGCFVP
jgi:hypothetical protein